jgi:hypothetical protein
LEACAKDFPDTKARNIVLLITDGKEECWRLKAIYQGLPSPLPPNATTYNTNYFTTISNTIYSSENDTVDSCEKCQSDINIDPQRDNFLVTIVKDETNIISINPPNFYTANPNVNFPITAFDPLQGIHVGLTNQFIEINVLALTPNTPQCITLYVNDNVYLSQTIPISNTGYYLVQFNSVTVLSTDTLQIQVFPGVCN